MNRVLCYLHGDAEAVAFTKARRQHKAILRFVEALAETLDDDGTLADFCLPTIDAILDGTAIVRFFIGDCCSLLDEPSRCLPVENLDELPGLLVEGFRDFAARLLGAADRLEGGAA